MRERGGFLRAISVEPSHSFAFFLRKAFCIFCQPRFFCREGQSLRERKFLSRRLEPSEAEREADLASQREIELLTHCFHNIFSLPRQLLRWLRAFIDRAELMLLATAFSCCQMAISSHFSLRRFSRHYAADAPRPPAAADDAEFRQPLMRWLRDDAESHAFDVFSRCQHAAEMPRLISFFASCRRLAFATLSPLDDAHFAASWPPPAAFQLSPLIFRFLSFSYF